RGVSIATLSISMSMRKASNVAAGYGRTASHVLGPFVIRVVANPLGNVGAEFGDESKAGVEFVGHDALVLPVVVADAEALFGDHCNIDRPAVFEGKIQTREQGREIVLRIPDDDGVPA